MRLDGAEGPSLVLRRPDVEPEEAEGNLAPGEEMQDDRGREQPDPEELRRRAAEASADAARARPTLVGGAGPASAEPRRRNTVKRSARPAERREERQNGGGDDPTVKGHQRDVSESLAQLCNCVPLSPWRVKLTVVRAGDVTSCTTPVVSVMSASQSCKSSACKTT